MAGRRILDAAIVANAVRGVAKQHLNLRSKQFDTWNKTSSLAKAVKDQTDRVTLTVHAANTLIQRLNETGPSYASSVFYASSGSADRNREPTPRHETPKTYSPDQPQPNDSHQHRDYQGVPPDNASQPLDEECAGATQSKPIRSHTPDGNAPPNKMPIGSGVTIDINSDVTSRRPTTASREGIQLQHREFQEPNIEIPQQAAIPEHDEVPEGVNTDVFHSPRVARKLGGRTYSEGAKRDMAVRRSAYTPLEKTELARGKDQDSFNVRGPSAPTTPSYSQPTLASSDSQDVNDLASDIAKEVSEPSDSQSDTSQSTISSDTSSPDSPQMRESRVPSSRFGRLAQYGSLATSMAFGAVGETFRRATGMGNSSGSLMLSAGNMDRLVAKLSRMRGAALKLGQMMSFQDSKMLPAPIHEVLQRVQDHADYMPPAQRNQVLSSNLGSEWRSLFSSFNDVPIAAASIGQVHRATLASNDLPVAVKIQYPGVAQSISSDLSNLSILLTASRLLPKGLYLDKTIANARAELAWECDYEREAAAQTRFRELLSDEQEVFTVPAIVNEASGAQVLTAELMPGTAVTKPSLNLAQEERDWIGTQILRLCLRELTEFKFMQTDPNWTNFLYNRDQRKLELLDFGAARDFPDRFVDPYIRILIAASHDDRDSIKKLSEELGYLTGTESRTMLDAHINSVTILAEPFIASANEDDVYDFRDQTITDRVRAQIPVMLRERLSPPPEETYSLHRKLSGAFLLLARLGSRVRCREMFVKAVDNWEARQKAAAST